MSLEQIVKRMVKGLFRGGIKALEQTTPPDQTFIIRGSFKANFKTYLFNP